MERNLGELKGELSQMNRRLDEVIALVSNLNTVSASSAAILERLSKEIDQHAKRLRELEIEQLHQGSRLDRVESDVDEHVKNDTPVSVVVGSWAVRVVWGAGAAALGALGKLLWDYIKR